jgi:hypothetical protein
MNQKQKPTTDKQVSNTPAATTKANSTKHEADAANSSNEDIEITDNEAL